MKTFKFLLKDSQPRSGHKMNLKIELENRTQELESLKKISLQVSKPGARKLLIEYEELLRLSKIRYIESEFITQYLFFTIRNQNDFADKGYADEVDDVMDYMSSLIVKEKTNKTEEVKSICKQLDESYHQFQNYILE